MNSNYPIILNNLSFVDGTCRSTDIEKNIVEVVKEYRSVLPDGLRLNMVAPDSIWRIPLAEGIMFQEWLFGRNGLDIDFERYIKRSLERGKSILDKLILEIDNRLIVDFTLAHEDIPQSVVQSGPMLAYVGGCVLLSLGNNKLFQDLSVDIEVRFLGADGEFHVSTESIQNISDGAMIKPSWCIHLKQILDAPVSGETLWNLLSNVCCHMVFLDRARRQILDLEGDMLKAVAERLAMMEVDLIKWDYINDPAPIWGSKVTAESKSRIEEKKVHFKSLEGKWVDYSDHARFTPGAGRIHFIIDRSCGIIEIAHVGYKL